MKRPNNYQHRIIWERANGRKLTPGMHVHHIDGNHLNNAPENLLEVSAKEHYRLHFERKDYGACILLAKSAGIEPDELAKIQRLHGLKCKENKTGFHSDTFERQRHISEIWKKFPPGRKPVTDGQRVLKFKTEDEVEKFISNNSGWRRGLPDSFKAGLKKTNRRITSEEAKNISLNRMEKGTHNFITEHTCPHCSKKGKGPMMKRWHFDKCKQK